MNAKTLVIGYGNVDRQDDGAGWHILKNLASKFGCEFPDDPGSLIEINSDTVDLLYIYQIFPELAETLSQYDRVCFVDAHTSEIPQEISWKVISPIYEKSPLTHHMTPNTVLSITHTIYDQVPEAILVSVQGTRFGFERKLSKRTEELVQIASKKIWAWINSWESL